MCLTAIALQAPLRPIKDIKAGTWESVDRADIDRRKKTSKVFCFPTAEFEAEMAAPLAGMATENPTPSYFLAIGKVIENNGY